MRNTKRIILLLVAVMAATSIAGGVALAAVINGGDGDNTIRGTVEADTINGNDGKDVIYGMEGDDEIDGGDRGDRLYGGDEGMSFVGNDRISGRAGDDKIFGGPGVDRLAGGYDADIIRDGPEDDASVDTIIGGPGGDQIYAANGSQTADIISCGDGRDEVRADLADQVASDCEVVEVVKEISVDLAGEKSVEQALQVADSVDAAPEELVANYEVGEDNYGFGYVLTDTEPTPSAEEVTQTMISAFQEDIQMLQESSLPTAPDQETATPDQSTMTSDQWAETPEAELAEEEATTSDLESVIDTVQSSGAKIDELTVQTATPIDQIEQNPAVESAVDGASLPPEEETAEPDNDNGSKDWSPKRGRVETACCGGAQNLRFVYQRFEWNAWRLNNLKNKNSRPWYEADNLYDRDRGTYLGELGYWSSNLPNFDYRDSELFDSSTTRVVTVGTLKAENLKVGKDYYTSVRATKGSQDSDGAGANAQYGRTIPGCIRTSFCTGPRGWASDILVNLGSYRAPGSATWYSQSP